MQLQNLIFEKMILNAGPMGAMLRGVFFVLFPEQVKAFD